MEHRLSAPLIRTIILLVLIGLACDLPQSTADTPAAPAPGEVTRLVEVTRVVTQEVPVQVTVIVTRDVVREVTRVVERAIDRVVTATAAPKAALTAAPTGTPPPAATAIAPTAPPPSIVANLRNSMRTTRTRLEEFGGLIDNAINTGYVSCERVVDLYDAVAASPTYNIAGSSANVQNAHAGYRSAVALFTTGARDMTGNCREYLANPGGTTIPFQQWGLARQKVTDALAVLNPALELLGN